MVYPSLPTSSVLHHASSGSASSVEPVTPTLPSSEKGGLDDNLGRKDSERRMSSTSNTAEESIPCKWIHCDHVATSPDGLYEHLCNAHIGRKSTNNLCLTCGWENCGVKCVKRDHITSHLRVHTPLKPHPCAVCGKTFKRPQDLKKHERIHTQEHHQLHKLSKATTTSDPEFNSRVAAAPVGGERRSSSGLEVPRSPGSVSLSPSSSSTHSNINPASPYDRLLPSLGQNHHSVSPIPSSLAALHRKQAEELFAYQQREWMVLQQLGYQQQQNQVMAAQLASEGLMKAGSKRGNQHEDDFGLEGFDQFLADMKKRKVEPVYDADMMHRLNSLMPPSLPTGYPSTTGHIGSFNSPPSLQPAFGNYPPLPYSVQPPMTTQLPIPEIRTEADLALFNQFMISLGRDAAGQNHLPQAPGFSMGHSNSHDTASGQSNSPHSDASAVEDLFNPEELASLGLAGLPGIPVQNNQQNSGISTGASLPPQTPISFGNVYPSFENFTPQHRHSVSGDMGKRAIAGLPRMSSQSAQPPRPPVLSNIYGLGATQYAELPPLHNEFPVHTTGTNNFASFDSLDQRSRSFISEATLAPQNFHKKSYRHVQPLGAAVSSRVRESSERTGIDDEEELDDYDEQQHMDMDDQAATPKMESVQALLLTDDQADPAMKLPAIVGIHDYDHDRESLPSIVDRHRLSRLRDPIGTANSSSGSSRPSSPPSRQLPIKRHTDDSLIRDVKRLELGGGERGEPPSARDSPVPEPNFSSDSRRGSQSILGLSLSKDDRERLREMRRRHAALIRSWVVAVNLEWKRRELEESRVQMEAEEMMTPREGRRLGLDEIAA